MKTDSDKLRATQFKAYQKAMAKLVTPEWAKQHQEIVAAWWGAGIAGGMFRAGYAAGKRAQP